MTVTRDLVEWFRAHARDLPWRGERRDPYRVLVSEIMLQQTQVDRVAPRFEAFLERFPTLADLATASEQDVLEAWSGLGYYRRARLLRRAAVAVHQRGGTFPREVSDLEHLPGIGPYTAAAIASLAFGAAAPVLDGNTMRVGARINALERDPRSAAGRREIRRWVLGLMPGWSPGEVNEALMELGATVCSPRAPTCVECPLAPVCAARNRGSQREYPRPPAAKGRSVEAHRWVAACCTDRTGRWLLERIDTGPVLRGLWLPPLAPADESGDPIVLARQRVPGLAGLEASLLEPVRHSITFRRLMVVPVHFAHCPHLGPDRVWAHPEAPGRATSSLLGKLAARVGEPAGKERP